MIVLRNVDVVETCNSKIQNNIENKRKIKKRKVKSEVLRVNSILPVQVNEKNMKRFYEKVEEKKKSKIGYKFLLHGLQK